jgi:hypothetical protein
MMALDLEMFRQAVVLQMEAWLSELPAHAREQPLIGFADGSGDTLSPQDIVRHVRQGTPEGDRLIVQALALSTSSVLRLSVII